MAILVAKKRFTVGKPTALTGHAPDAHRSVSFVDDGEEGTLYADYDGMPERWNEKGTLDALIIYDVRQDNCRMKHTAKIVWSDDGTKAALLIDDRPEAIFDFAAKRGYCRTGLPRPSGQWKAPSHDWDEQVADFLNDFLQSH